jgi:hypothetical protein
MRIVFEQTGGFMGRTVTLTLDLGDLTTEQADALQGLLQEANLLDPEPEEAESLARDDYRYTITVESERVEHTVRVGDASAPSNLRPLIEELSKRARSQRK